MSSLDYRRVLLKYALTLLNRQAYFRLKLIQKLRQKAQKLNIPDFDNVISGIIQSLEKDGFLNDRSLAESFARRELGKYYGPRLIVYKLSRLGFSHVEAQEIVSTLDPAEIADQARRYLQKKRVSDPRKMNFVLYSRGFDSQQLRGVIDVDEN